MSDAVNVRGFGEGSFAPFFGNIIEEAEDFIGIVLGYEAHTGFLEVGQTFEVAAQVAAHLVDADGNALQLNREAEMPLGELHAFLYS